MPFPDAILGRPPLSLKRHTSYSIHASLIKTSMFPKSSYRLSQDSTSPFSMMQFTTLLGIFGAATALAAPAFQAGVETPRLNHTKPFEIDRLYMEMDSVWDTSYGVTIKFSITDPNTGFNTFCNMTDVHPSTAYACTRDQTKWSLNTDFSKISVEWIWASG